MNAQIEVTRTLIYQPGGAMANSHGSDPAAAEVPRIQSRKTGSFFTRDAVVERKNRTAWP
ncbi:hypothetical protein [Stenotrophomonas sp.]|uniref:hypothetical protein n=1 Tax=Stenotrophomonas sp. TaxID=69392 RepID=UPI0028A08F23|nr:hypothetical protein [Stenotrophomonas sp.]